VEEFLPPAILQTLDLMEARRALRQIHFPDSEEEGFRARRRMAFDELFLIETTLALRKARQRKPKERRFTVSDELDARIRRLFPFALTDGQNGAIRDIRSDLAGPAPTYRLVQGDVGSGKTVVALYFLLAVIAMKGQAALMAPTEVLADQHYRNVSDLLEGSRVRILRLTGGQAGKKRSRDLQTVESGEVDLVIGTHAVIQRDVRFRDLQALVVDEQHKFGVLQRAALREKGEDPEVLVMTATPIPRSLSLTIYGDLDLSVIRDMPPGRLPVRTVWVRRADREKWYRALADEMDSERQVYFVYPVIDETKDGDIRSATEMYDRLSKEVFRRHRVALLHGRMARDEKDAILGEFREGRTDLLVSTIVIEVGIDIPNATVMVVDHAERFGLAQLHQLRGRIGRGRNQSTCLLFGDPRTPEGRERLRVMERTSDGFRIAEEDLRIRGPGEFFGTRQSGLPPLRVADPIRDMALLEEARREAFRIVAEDPSLRSPENRALRGVLVQRMRDKAGLADIG
jgi:ATP-dependent DNA helicase RecG